MLDAVPLQRRYILLVISLGIEAINGNLLLTTGIANKVLVGRPERHIVHPLDGTCEHTIDHPPVRPFAAVGVVPAS